jgi:DNA polymerase III subunit alpha
MCKNEFVHLHCHSTYSVQDALPLPADLAHAADEIGFPAIALTDHGRMSGTVEFVDACRKTKNNVKPIIGVEVYTCQDMYDKTAPEGRKRPKHNHLTLLAKNDVGYRNLLAISSIAAEEGFYYDPRVDHTVLESHSEGVIALSGCLASEINQSLLKGDYKSASESADWFKSVYGDDFFIELQYHGIEEQKNNMPGLLKISKDLNIKPVASNDVHYISKPDWAIHDVLIQMRNLRENKQFDPKYTGKKKAYETKQFYLKTQEQMLKIFGAKVPESISNTLLINEKIEDYFKLDIPHQLPNSHIPTNDMEFNNFRQSKLPYHNINDAYLAHLAFSGLKKRGLDKNKHYINRLKKELSQIWFMGVTDYFLIYNEIITYMKVSDITYGVRGSAVGSLVNYCLEICPVDPIRWGLVFERFLNPGRGTQYDLEFKIDDFVCQKKYENTEAIKSLRAIIRERIQNISTAKEHSANLSRELWVIENQNLASYYMELYESNRKIKSNDPNSYVAYYLGITDEIPDSDLHIKKVATLPDVDTDIDDSRRDDVINWTKQRFGEDKVVNIAAWGTYGAKASVLGALKTSVKFNEKYNENPHQAALRVTATVPKKPGISIDDATKMSSDFAYWKSKFSEEIENAKGLFGKISNLSVHAGGIIVSKDPVSEHTPVENSKGTLCSGYEWESVERVGLVKYDILGLKTYRMLDICKKMVKTRHGVDVNLWDMDFEDDNVYKLFKKGQTSTVFQFGSLGMQEALKKVKASDMEDLIAVVSLYRPGPMEYIPVYAKRKLGKESYSFSHELIEKHLGYTYGILIYQEQAMLLAKEMAGFSWSEVDKLRKAISKKSSKDFHIMLDQFREKSIARGIPPKVCEEVIGLMDKFGGYAFNRSHAASYAILAYWTAYMRWYYPAEWLASCIQVDIDKDDEMIKYIDEASFCNISVIYPDVNESEMEISFNSNNDIILPLTFCKGAGSLTAQIIEHKPYVDFQDLVSRARPHKGVIKALALGNAFKSLEDIKDFSALEVIEFYEKSIKELKRKPKKESKDIIKQINSSQPASTVKSAWGASDLFEDFD